ncbi:glycosyltransferase family 1 protein [Thelonectria olida]|uniref:Glycosyltransferase family 1 protein n=1 Tax=Thelonectria olida TaxID=1576542 RepID=A0A9P8W101_9HYPO|nr:glycosyltransferase family 1 protein [Thelonectria olida]
MAEQVSAKPNGHRKILLLTNIEHGESNVFLATFPALFELDPDVEVHFATYGGFEPFVDAVWEQPIVFHEIKGIPALRAVHECMQRQNVSHTENLLPKSFTMPPGLVNTSKAIDDTRRIFVPYTGPQMTEIFSSIVDIIKTVNADLVVVNGLLTPGLTALYHLGVRFACLSPNSIKDCSAPLQPHAAVLWKYPALFSAFSYPVPWHLIPLNIYFCIYGAITFARDKERRAVMKYLQAETGAQLRTPIDLLRNRPPSLKILVGTLPELDFPVIVPDHVLPCGPIIRQAPPLSESDPALQTWLAKGPTIYINLGSMCRLLEDDAVELASAVQVVMKKVNEQPGTSPLQVLWKLKKAGEYSASEAGSKLHNVLGKEMEADLVRISDWIQAEPISILRSGHVVCSIHHGGANSFSEAIRQVVLPQWTDCYDYAQRVEMLGVGRWGSRDTKPKWTSQGLARKLSDVLQGETSEAMKKRAVELAGVCKEKGNGAVHAAKIILAECHENWVKAEGK